jgi:hypothetical protein
MSEMGEAALVEKLLEHQAEDCPFCKENQKPKGAPKSNAEPLWDEDAAAARKEAIGNSSGELEKHMSISRPTDWVLKHPVYNCAREELELEGHRVTANPHHLIPGNESLKEVPDLLKWIFEGEGHIEADIGYDVNNGDNGIWLPSNNSMRSNRLGNSSWECETVKMTYVNAAQPGHGTFHDRHLRYSDFVRKILQKIADRMDGIDARANCPYKTEKGTNRFKPPYALVQRLNTDFREARSANGHGA